VTARDNQEISKIGSYGVFDKTTETALIEAAEKAVPVDDEQIGYIGNEPIFVLCQYLRGVSLPEDTTFEDLRPFTKYWFDLSEDKLIDEDGENLSFAEVYAMAIELWDKVKYAKGSALDSAIVRAKASTYTIPELEWCDDERILLLARICYELSRPDGDFFLSGDDAGKVIGKTQKTGRNALKMFEYVKIIKCVNTGHTGKASDYEYVGKPVIETKPNNDFEKKRQKMIEDLRVPDNEDNSNDNR